MNCLMEQQTSQISIIKRENPVTYVTVIDYYSSSMWLFLLLYKTLTIKERHGCEYINNTRYHRARRYTQSSLQFVTTYLSVRLSSANITLLHLLFSHFIIIKLIISFTFAVKKRHYSYSIENSKILRKIILIYKNITSNIRWLQTTKRMKNKILIINNSISKIKNNS